MDINYKSQIILRFYYGK